jgi:hypothetical protein
VRRLLLAARAPFTSPILARGMQRMIPALLAIGTACVLGGLTLIWAARLTFDRPVYVSEIGAQGAPTASVFAVALLLIAAGGFAIAVASGHVRSSVRWLDRWAPALSLGFAAVCFVVASQVTCTANCPVPLADPRSTAQDLLHTVSAVLGFAAACFAMLQVAFARQLPRVARVSLVSCVAVAGITILGGMLAIVHVATDVGAWLELVGTTVAILWIAVYSIALARGTTVPMIVEAAAPASTSPKSVLGGSVVDGSGAPEAVV